MHCRDLFWEIIVYGVIVELAGVWFVTDKVRYTTGLLIGISLACGMAVNIATVLRVRWNCTARTMQRRRSLQNRCSAMLSL